MKTLIRVHFDNIAARIHVHRAALVRLFRRHVGSGLDAASLIHVLVGFLPEFLDEEWELHERVVEVLLRHRRRARARPRRAQAALGPRRARRRG